MVVILSKRFCAQRRACPELVEGIWASRAMRRALCDAVIARLARFLTSHACRHFPRVIQGNQAMSVVRRFAKSCAVLLLGKETKPRRILSGLASGYRISVSPAEKLSYLLGLDEPHLQKAIRQFVAAGDTVYDIGANLGYVSLSLAKRVGPQGRVIAFEPIPLILPPSGTISPSTASPTSACSSARPRTAPVSPSSG